MAAAAHATARSATGCTCIFVDNGLLRAGEREQVERDSSASASTCTLRRVDARERFLDALAGVTDPEKKRKIIGHVFIDVFEEEAQQDRRTRDFLAQGTLYPDVIESGLVQGPVARRSRATTTSAACPSA